MESSELESAILSLVRRPGYHPVKPRVIAQRLGLTKSAAPAVRKAVKGLVARGELAYGASHLVRPSQAALAPRPAAPGEAGPAKPAAARPRARPQRPRQASADRIVGVFRQSSAGYGFVRPARPDAGQAPAQEMPEAADVYVAAEDSADAASGDLVAVRLVRQRGRRLPGPRGRILEILERETHRFVGTYFESQGTAYVQVDGQLFSQPILVGDPGAHRLRPDDKVVLEMVRFPSYLHEGEGVVVEVLGPAGKPGVDTLSVLREFDLPDQFPEDALEEARHEAERFDGSIPADRLDATGEIVITIDPTDARDFDDAISLVQLDGGHWRLGVHIADVAHFVRPKTALDREAYHRATSVYLPDRVLPMLPETISNSLASLQPGKVRYARSAFLEFTADGLRVDAEFHRSAIRSRRRLTYDQVDQFLADPGLFRPKWGAQVCGLLERMRALARLLRARRMAQGALELAMPEVKVDLDKDGRVVGAHVEKYTESHQIIEEFMLAANEAVAEMLRDKGLAFLRRIHRPPALRKLQALAQFIRELGLPADELTSRFGLQRLLDEVLGRPEQHAVHYAVLRSLQRAMYGPHEEGHYALASDCYAHFTSPIRRYPDLTVHRLVDAVLTGKRPRQDVGELVVVGEHCSEREQRAEAAERQLVRLKILHYFSDRIGEEMDAVVTGVEAFGLFVQGREIPAEGLVHVDSLADDYYRFDRAAHTLSGHRSGNAFRLGDLVRVAVARVDLERRELDFRLVRRQPKPEPGRGEQPKAARPARPGKPRRQHGAPGHPKGRKRRQRP
jgi:ribonuclease R